ERNEPLDLGPDDRGGRPRSRVAVQIRSCMVEITAIHQVGGIEHPHIASVRWRNPQGGGTGQNSREEMVAWLRASRQNQAYVSNGATPVYVGVRDATPPYIQTYADGIWLNIYMALPLYL